MMYNALVKKAAEKGYREVVCDGCKGKGISVRGDANSPIGKITDNPCQSCNGSGRLWQYGRSIHTINDDALEKL